jgi:tRNA-specific 2-thiouridylase
MDSLLSLLLLREEGREVLALHGRFLPASPARDRVEEALDRACRDLSIPLRLVDLVSEFEALVVAPFVREYEAGRTPNPCARCNPAVKFGLLLDAALAMGAAGLATGHYARLVPDAGGQPRLFRGLDPAKDQSYFLSLVPPERLELARFPLGGRFKLDTPAALAAFGAAAPAPAESQEICFVPGDDYRAFLKDRGARLSGPGPILLSDGREVGRHQGLWAYTLGQRRGLNVAHSEPLYVLSKDLARNALLVGPAAEVPVSGCRVGEVVPHRPAGEWPGEVLAQVRYRQKARPARWELAEGGLRLIFPEPWDRPAPGQVAALYTAEGEVLAGGIIL